MGPLYSQPETRKKLCDDIIEDTDFSIQITIHSLGKFPDFTELLGYLQSTAPSLSYSYCKSIYLLYDAKNKHPVLRSNVSGEIIALMASDVTRYCIVNNICDPYYVEVDLVVEDHQLAKAHLISLMENNLYYGHLYGVDKLSEEIKGLLL